MKELTLKVFCIRFSMAAIAGFAIARIGSCTLDSIEAYNSRLVERWLDKVAKVHIGMTSDDLFAIFGKPAVRFERLNGAMLELKGDLALCATRFEDTNGVVSLIFETPYARRKGETECGLIPNIFYVELVEGVVADFLMGYR